ncbi:MAG: hypothetical protein K2O03_12540, partial [Lachnospiraceae bacterium]|nr:hypothetical protein [Lachnospiraceae bacterium]
MDKKRKTLLAWLTALAMVVSMLHVGTGSVVAYAAEGDSGGQAQTKAVTVTGSAIGYNLELGKTYDGAMTLKGNGKGSYETYFSVEDADIAIGDVYDVSITLEAGSDVFKQIAIQSDCDYWDWSDKYVHTKWMSGGLVSGTEFSVSLQVTESLTGKFQVKIYMDNAKEDATVGDNVDIVVSSFKVV